MTYYLGVDIGASTVKLGMYSTETGVIGGRYDYPSRASEGPQATMRIIKDGFAQLTQELELDPADVVGAGVCCPTPVNQDGMCLYPTNIDASWQGFNVRDTLTDVVKLPAVLLNDGDAAAYREFSFRKLKGRATSSMAQFITGTGLGGAIIIDGEILIGPGVSAELGHVVTDTSRDADLCGCGARGCAETRASLLGLRNLVRLHQSQRNLPSELQGDPMVVARKLRNLGQQDSPHQAVLDIWHVYFTNLGRAIRSVANVIGCDLVVISGGAHEREESASEAAHQRFLSDGIAWIRMELDGAYPHLRQVKVEWAIDDLPDSACYGVAAYAAQQLNAGD